MTTIYSEADMGDMSHYDPNLGLGKAGYAKAVQNHIATINQHLQSVGMNATSTGAKQVADGIHKAAMYQMFNQPQNSNSTAPTANRGTSSGFMVNH